MPSAILRKLYFNVRKADVCCIVGEHAKASWSHAKILRKWHALERLGFVRLTAEPDIDWEPDCDCGNSRCPSHDPESEAFGSIGEFCLPNDDDWDPSDDWRHADSVWGHVGYRNVLDWRENPYILDIMAETIDAFRTAWKARTRQERKAK